MAHVNDAMTAAIAVLEECVKEFEDRLEGAKGNTLANHAILHHTVAEHYAALDEVRKRLYKAYDHDRKTTLPERFEDEGVDMLRVPELKRSFGVLTKHSASTKDKEAAMAWLRANGAESLISETVNASTLSAYLASRITDEGKDPPEELFNFSTYRLISMRQYTPKEG